MLDPLSLALGAALSGLGFLLGNLRRAPRPALPSSPTCPCSHVIALHDPEDKRCRAQVRREHYTVTGERYGFEYVPCACRRYLGPELLTDVWAGPGTSTP